MNIDDHLAYDCTLHDAADEDGFQVLDRYDDHGLSDVVGPRSREWWENFLQCFEDVKRQLDLGIFPPPITTPAMAVATWLSIECAKDVMPDLLDPQNKMVAMSSASGVLDVPFKGYYEDTDWDEVEYAFLDALGNFLCVDTDDVQNVADLAVLLPSADRWHDPLLRGSSHRSEQQ